MKKIWMLLPLTLCTISCTWELPKVSDRNSLSGSVFSDEAYVCNVKLEIDCEEVPVERGLFMIEKVSEEDISISLSCLDEFKNSHRVEAKVSLRGEPGDVYFDQKVQLIYENNGMNLYCESADVKGYILNTSLSQTKGISDIAIPKLEAEVFFNFDCSGRVHKLRGVLK